MTVEDLLHLVPNLITKVDSLETELKQTKLTMGNAIVKLGSTVKKNGRYSQRDMCSKGDFLLLLSRSGRLRKKKNSPTTLKQLKLCQGNFSRSKVRLIRIKRYKRRKVVQGQDIELLALKIYTGFEEVNNWLEQDNTGGLGLVLVVGPVSFLPKESIGRKTPIIHGIDSSS
ncbi:hypothetical protein Tco_0065811 [Tanacetum coccineum]